MPIDIKRGISPYKEFSRPSDDKESSHILRYFEKHLFSVMQVIGFVFCFIFPFWFFGVDSRGSGEIGHWISRDILFLIFLSVLIFAWAFYIVVLEKKIEYTRLWLLNASMAILVIMTIVSAFFGYDALQSFGFRFSGMLVTAPDVVIGILWMLFLVNLAPVRLLKMMLVAHMLGSSLFAIAVLFGNIFSIKALAITGVWEHSWLMVFAVNVFLLIGFTMLQKGIAKFVWSLSIAAHLFVLFLFDSPVSWLAAIIGISILLAFQIFYSKKLWQKNFTYPLQVWGFCVILLILPIKMFTGSAPITREFFDANIGVFKESSSMSEKIIGFGSANSFFALLENQQEGIDIRETANFNLDRFAPMSGWNAIVIEYGLLGSAVFILLFAVIISRGIFFLKRNLQTYKQHISPNIIEGDMSETSYLAGIIFLAFCLALVLSLFEPWSLVSWWVLVLLSGLSISFQRAESQDKAGSIDLRKSTGRFWPSLGVLSVFVVIILSVLIFNVRASVALSFASKAINASDARDKFELWQSAYNKNPRNDMLAAQRALAELNLLSQETPLDVQRDILESSSRILSKVVEKSKDPFAKWVAADAYIMLESYAEGSVQLARKTYLDIIKRMPRYLYVPVALAQFYEGYEDQLVSEEMSSDQLRKEAMDYLRSALDIEPSFLPARLELSFFIEQQDGIAAAIAELEPWEDQSPEIMYHVGRLYFNDKNFQIAAEKFGQVVREVPSHSNARYSLAIAYFRLERFDESLQEFQSVLELNPGNEDVQAKIDQVKEKLGE